MTISNSNLLSILPASFDVPLDGMIAGDMVVQIESQLVDSELLDQPLLEGDFWSMLSQQLADISASEDLQDIQNNLGVNWVQTVKAHFSESEIAQIDETVETTEIPVPVVAALNLTEPVVASLSQNGDKLPPSRQIVSVVTPVQLLSNNEATVSDDVEMIDLESDDKLLISRNSEIDIKSAESEKLQVKQPIMEQSGPAIKENSAAVFNQVNQISATAPQTQTNLPLSLSLQTMQLSPQATASQWGDALGERVSLLLNNKLNTAEIRLDPPHLGKLDIQIQLKEDSATIMISTQHAQTRDLIESASIRLREFLQGAGYSSVDVDVSHQEQSMAQSNLSQHENDQQNGNSDEQQSSAQSEVSEAHQSELYLTVDNGRIDYFA